MSDTIDIPGRWKPEGDFIPADGSAILYHDPDPPRQPTADELLDELIHAISQYALKQGEAWRIGEGTEIMDALDALLDGR